MSSLLSHVQEATAARVGFAPSRLVPAPVWRAEISRPTWRHLKFVAELPGTARFGWVANSLYGLYATARPWPSAIVAVISNIARILVRKLLGPVL